MSSFLLLLSLYLWAILAGLIAAPSLALLGTQLATRDRAMQILCVGQGAMLGVLMGIGLLHDYEGTLFGSVGPYGLALIVSSITYLVTEKIIGEKVASKNTTFAFIFALLISISNFVSALFPGLESHMSQIYFGDLATLKVMDSKILLGMGVVFLVCACLFVKVISRNSFESAVFGKVISTSSKRSERLFQVASLAVLCLSVQFLGYLFTIACLFIPTALLSYLKTRGLKLHLVLCSSIAILGTFIGFMVSLWHSRLPTVPSIVITFFLEGLLILVAERLLLSKKMVAYKVAENPV